MSIAKDHNFSRLINSLLGLRPERFEVQRVLFDPVCPMKDKYSSPQRAWTAIKSHSRHVRNGLVPYKCPSCHQYHLTSIKEDFC